MNTVENKIESIIEDIQESIIDCGGRFFRREELKGMTVQMLLELLVPNNVEFKINLKK